MVGYGYKHGFVQKKPQLTNMIEMGELPHENNSLESNQKSVKNCIC